MAHPGAPHILEGHIQLTIVTPEGSAFDGAVDTVVVPGYDGEVAFLPGHAAYVGLLGAGEMRCHVPQGGTHRWFLAGGVVQVVDDQVSVLADAVVPVASLDAAKARAELEAALATKATDEESEATRERAILAARAKLRLAERGVPGGAPAAH
jgi:F-type H+-transporting ATPase subunit epsilon